MLAMGKLSGVWQTCNGSRNGWALCPFITLGKLGDSFPAMKDTTSVCMTVASTPQKRSGFAWLFSCSNGQSGVMLCSRATSRELMLLGRCVMH